MCFPLTCQSRHHSLLLHRLGGVRINSYITSHSRVCSAPAFTFVGHVPALGAGDPPSLRPPFARLYAFPWLVDFVPPAVHKEGVAQPPAALVLGPLLPGTVECAGLGRVLPTRWLSLPGCLLQQFWSLTGQGPCRAAQVLPRPPTSLPPRAASLLLCSNLPSTFVSLPATDQVLPGATSRSPPTSRPHCLPLGHDLQ